MQLTFYIRPYKICNCIIMSMMQTQSFLHLVILPLKIIGITQNYRILGSNKQDLVSICKRNSSYICTVIRTYSSIDLFIRVRYSPP